MAEREHGYARYKLDGCRCYTCGWAVARYRDARETAVRRGEWQPFVDAEPVRQHIQNLQECGIGLRRIAEAAGVDRKRLQGILTGRPERNTPPQKQVRPALSLAVLAVQPSLKLLGGATPVGSTGTLRRLQALLVAGWPQHHLAVALGMADSNFDMMLDRPRVLARTAVAVEDLYSERWSWDPRQHGVSEVQHAKARRRAISRGWAPVGAWDDDTIDDPAAYPDWTGLCGTTEGYAAHRRLEIPACSRCRDARNDRRRALRDLAA